MIRVGPSIVSGRVVCGFRGLGILGSALAHGGDYDGLLYLALGSSLVPTNYYRYFIPTVPSGLTNIQPDGSFDYLGPSTSFNMEVYEDGVYLGLSLITITVVGGAISVSGSTSGTSIATATVQVIKSVVGSSIGTSATSAYSDSSVTVVSVVGYSIGVSVAQATSSKIVQIVGTSQCTSFAHGTYSSSNTTSYIKAGDRIILTLL